MNSDNTHWPEDSVFELVKPEIENNYRVLDYLGGGGLSTIYLIEHQYLETKRVLKIMDVDYFAHMLKKNSDENLISTLKKIIARFKKEAEIFKKLNHPNIVKIHDINFVTLEKYRLDIPYLILEYIEGYTLRDFLGKHSPLDNRTMIRLSKEILSALSEIHAQKIVHRDIKPANILIEKNTERTVLIDFGLAKDISMNDQLSQSTIMGTPAYIAPETFAPNSIVGPEADIYAFGIVLYEMVTGEKPFKSNNQADLIYDNINRKIPDAFKKNRKAPKELYKIIKKATAKKPEDRYRDAGELLDTLNKLLEKKNNIQVKTIFPYIAAFLIFCSVIYFVFYNNDKGPRTVETQKSTAGGFKASVQKQMESINTLFVCESHRLLRSEIKTLMGPIESSPDSFFFDMKKDYLTLLKKAIAEDKENYQTASRNNVYDYYEILLNNTFTTHPRTSPLSREDRGFTNQKKKKLSQTFDALKKSLPPKYCTIQWTEDGFIEAHVDIEGVYRGVMVYIPHAEGYWIGKTEVSASQYCTLTGHETSLPGERPIVNISYEEAEAYCEELTEKTGLHFALPTFEQWKCSALGPGLGSSFPWGEAYNVIKDGRIDYRRIVNVKLGKELGAFNVSSCEDGASVYGVLNTFGNVEEFCRDGHTNGSTEPASPCIVGGSFKTEFEILGHLKKNQKPIKNLKEDKHEALGFRLCLVTK